MDSLWIKLKCWGLVVVLAAGGSSLAFAQSATLQGQAIQFSSPDASDGPVDSPSLTPKAPPLPDFPGAPQASSIFGFNAPARSGPLPRPQIFAPSQRARDAADQKKNWVLMTPEEILGVKTPEQIMGIPERDAAGQEKRLTPLERYWERQNASHVAGTNGYQPAGGLGRMNFQDDQSAPFSADTANTPTSRNMDSKSIWNNLLNSGQSVDAAGQNGGGMWQKLLGAPQPSSPVAVQTSDQLADLERFRQLLGSASPPAVAAPPTPSIFYASPDSSSDPILGEIKVNPAGASFTPLSSGISVPKGLSSLPGITTQSRAAAATPTLMPQNPPWVMNGPDLFTPPQRKF